MRFRLRHLALAIAGSLGCTAAAERADRQAAPADTAAGTVALAADSTPNASPEVVRALYVNRWASQSRRRMAKLIAAADSTEINGLVIDMKDEFGLNYKTANKTFAKNAGTAPMVPNVAALLDTLKAQVCELTVTLAHSLAELSWIRCGSYAGLRVSTLGPPLAQR